MSETSLFGIRNHILMQLFFTLFGLVGKQRGAFGLDVCVERLCLEAFVLLVSIVVPVKLRCLACRKTIHTSRALPWSFGHVTYGFIPRWALK